MKIEDLKVGMIIGRGKAIAKVTAIGEQNILARYLSEIAAENGEAEGHEVSFDSCELSDMWAVTPKKKIKLFRYTYKSTNESYSQSRWTSCTKSDLMKPIDHHPDLSITVMIEEKEIEVDASNS